MMAIVMRMKGAGIGGGGGDEKNPLFHDFLGITSSSSPAADPPATHWEKGRDGGTKGSEAEPMVSASPSPSPSVSLGASSGAHGLFSGTSDLGSERHGVNNSEDFHFHGRKNVISVPEPLSGRKRNSSDIEHSILIKDRMLQVGSDHVEKSQLYKMFGKDVGERSGRSRDNELLFPARTSPMSGSITPHHPLGSRPDSPMPRWEHCVPVNPGRIVPKASRFAHAGTCLEKASPSYVQKDASAGATVIAQSAADEGSRTGIKSSGVIRGTNPSNESGERSSVAVLPNANVGRNAEQELYNLPRCHIAPSAGRQMTIFYAGQAHVFDDVHPNKADVIMALAGSSGGSWTTTYAATSTERPTTNDAKVPSRQETENGLNQTSRMLSGSDTSGLRVGRHQSVATARDGRLMTQAAAGPQTQGKRGDV